MILRLLLTLSLAAPPTEDEADAAYAAGNLEAALQMYLQLAEAPGAHPPRALDGAHASLRALHRKDPRGGHLCRARDLARELVKRDAFASEQERGAWIEMEAEDERDLAGVSCPATVADAAKEPAETNEGTKSEAAGARAEGPAPAPAAEPPQGRSVARLAVGGTLAGLAAPLAVGMAASLVGRRHAAEDLAAINARYTAEDRPPTEAELAAGVELNDRGRRLGATALALGLTAGASLVAGLAVMLARSRADSRARLRASGAGLVYSF